MKKNLLIIGLVGITSISMFSCKKDDPTPVQTELPTKFSSRTSEENKAQLESNGLKIIDQLELLKNSKGVEAVSSLTTLINNSDGSFMRKSSGGALLTAIKSMGSGKGSSDAVFTTMRLSETPTSLKEAFEQNSGTYTWNSSTEVFDFIEGGGQIVFKYPAKESGTSNNAALTLKDYQGITPSKNNIEGYEGDLPTKLLMELTADGGKVMDYSFTASYNNAGEPTTLNSSLTLAPFAYTVKANNSTKEASFDYTFTKDNQILISYGASAKGNFTSSNLENAEKDSDVVTEVSSHFQLLNIKISGSMDVASLEKELQADTVTNEDVIVNKHLNMIVYYADSNEKIADTEYYTKKVTNTYTYYYDSDGDGVDEEYTEVYEDKSADLRLIFADGSKSDLETYFSNGFDNLQSRIDELVGN